MTTQHAPAAVSAAPRSDATLAQELAAACERWAQRPALVSRHATLTYGELGAAARRLATSYAALGVGAGDRIVTSISNRPEAMIAMAAAWHRGAVHVAADYQFTGHELVGVIERTDARVLVYEPPPDSADPFLAVREVRAQLPDLDVIVVGDAVDDATCARFADLLDGAGESARIDPAPAAPAIIFLSSGTTGVPKATIGYQENLGQRWRRLGGWLGFTPEDAHLAQLPLSHGFGMMMALSALFEGGRLVLLERFSVRGALDAIERERVSVFNGAPAHFRLLLARLDEEPREIGSLRLSVGTAAAFPRSLVQQIWDRLGVSFMYMYGSSEGIGFATTDREDILLGSVGRTAPGSVAVVDADRRPLAVGEVGELAFSRRVFPIRAWDGDSGGDSEWYYSGDRGRLDDEGRLYIYGRLKHQIDRGGLKVDPVEVEAALLQLPRIADATVVGQPDPILGEIICACVVTTGEQPQPRLAEVRDWVGRSLAPFKLPDEMRCLREIPRTKMGKVDLDRLHHVIETTPHIVERRAERR